MYGNNLLKVPAVALVALLTACGGGGGDGDNFEPVDISSSAGALMAALPAIQTTEIDHMVDTFVSDESTQSSLLGSRWLTRSQAPKVRAKRGGAQGASAPMATTTEPCSDGGSTVTYDPTQRDVDSPYTDVLFNVDRWEDRDCITVYSFETGTTTYEADGFRETGCPTDDPEFCYIEYRSIGTPQTRARFRIHHVDSTFGEFENDGLMYGVTHSQYDSNYSRLDEAGFMNFDFDETFIDNGEGGSGTSVSYSFSGYSGTASNPFVIHDDNPGISVDGPYGLNSPDFPGCELGEATLHTLVPMYVDSETSNVVGTVAVTSGTRSAVVEMNADGTVEVTIDGNTQTLSADQVGTIRAGCPFPSPE